jgi:hypothetical protein
MVALQCCPDTGWWMAPIIFDAIDAVDGALQARL